MTSTFISRFTPSLMKQETLETIFVQRETLAQHLVEVISESALTANKHFRLLVGMRGIGKTHLIALIYHRVSKMEDLRDKLLIAWLAEEEWGVTSFLEFLRRIFWALEKEYPEEYNAQLNQKVKELEAIYQSSPDEAEHTAAALLKDFVGKRTLLLLVENLDDLFDGLGDIGQKQLRAYIHNYSFLTILATAQSLFDGVRLQDYPFYGTFNSHNLEKLKLDEAVDLLTKIANLEGNSELESFIQTPTGRNRIKAVHHLACGNHRIYVIFAEFLTRKKLDELIEQFNRTVDELTPYYQGRMAWLSQEERKIVKFLCDRQGAIPIQEIAESCLMEYKTASSNLKDLERKGYVIYEAIGDNYFYELQDPLMRLCLEVKQKRTEPICLCVDFLRKWYSRNELEEQLKSPLNNISEFEIVLAALKKSEKNEPEDQRVPALWKEYETHIKKADFDYALKQGNKLLEIRGHASDYLAVAFTKLFLGRYNEALECCDEAIKIEPNNSIVWWGRGKVFYEQEDYDKALESFDEAYNFDPRNLIILFDWKCCYLKNKEKKGENDDLESLDREIEGNPNNIEVWSTRAWRLSALGKYKEALESYDKVISLDPFDESAWSNRGWVLCGLERYDDALASYNKALELDLNYGWAWCQKGWVLERLEKWNKALEAYDKAIELDEKYSWIFFHRAQALLMLNHWDEGSVALDDALERFAHSSEPNTGDTAGIIRNLFNDIHHTQMWRSRISTLIEIYNKHQVVAELGQGIVRSIPALMSEMVSDKAAQTWLEVWQELTSEYKEFQIPLRLLNTAVKYRVKKGDRRVLLELAIEERQLLEPLLGAIEPINMKVK
ncbi:tetratricopeptide repeat protein [Argonema antarcticum]|uniref:tetratricopeptide repeat protein n=1 Tax=Argonema antarcticum TaxID=2942763 RepID=UPI002012B58C|nr:tetratricopeptide repeat protein [Argonema antarcticum]MCL1469139.1 tetratricopeptide repeat protein [Argonema antarcticum A004/B2]